MRQLKQLLRYVEGTENMATVFEMRDDSDRRVTTVTKLDKCSQTPIGLATK